MGDIVIFQFETGAKSTQLDPPREKETYAIVDALRKWDGWV